MHHYFLSTEALTSTAGRASIGHSHVAIDCWYRSCCCRLVRVTAQGTKVQVVLVYQLPTPPPTPPA